jgi:hypothetical protein
LTAGLDEEVVTKYIRYQEKEDECMDQFNLDFENLFLLGDS